jgi:succinyl-CoA synthetase beta subunit
MDRSYGGPVVIASATGGVTIEDIAAANPAAIIKAGLSQKYRLM